jgi:hypothetical protein
MSTIPPRSWPRPDTSDAPAWTTIAHQQLTQNSPRHIQEQLWGFLEALPSWTTGKSMISVPWAKAVFHNDHQHPLAWAEWVHLHPEYDGSLHIGGQASTLKDIVDAWRGEYHPRNPNAIMLYGPRDDSELAIIKSIIQRIYQEWITDEPS